MPEKKCWETEIINAGFKAVAAKVHPDKPGGSKEAMQELGTARERLKFILGKFQEWEETERVKSTMTYATYTPGTVYPPSAYQPNANPVIELIDSVSELFRGYAAAKKSARRRPRKR